jgi:hypothetical protein
MCDFLGEIVKILKSLAAIACLSLFVLAGPSVAVGDEPVPSASLAQLSWKTPISVDFAADQPFRKLWVTQAFQGGMPIANIPHLTSLKGKFPNVTDGKLCDQLDDTCLPDANWAASGYGNFQLCSVSDVAPCIRGLQFQDSNGKWNDAVLSHEADLSAVESQTKAWLQNNNWGEPGTTLQAFQTKWGWSPNKNIGLPGSGKGPLVFKFPGRVNAAGSDTYALDSNFSIEASKTPAGAIKIDVTDFNFQISPVKEIACDNRSVSVTVQLKRPDGRVEFGQTGGSCIDPALYSTPTTAGFPTKFADNLPIKLDLELPKKLSGWFQGRLNSPDVTVTSLGNLTSSVQITGEPISVPATNKALDLSAEANQKVLGGPDYDWARNTAKFGYLGLTGSIWSPAEGLNSFNKWAPYLDQRARGSVSMWTISHFNSTSSCMNATDGLQGIVTTNAMVYQPNTPTFDGGFLKYSVGGVHYDQDGSVVLGTYNFIMRSSVARCLYGFRDAPISGTVSVTSSEGQENVAITSVTEKGGWLRLSALGFTFSSPTISAKLTQAGYTPKMKTLVCVKIANSKITKKVVGTFPKCPKGYKTK